MSGYNIIKIGIIDLKINNLYSIYNAFKKIGYKTKIIKNKKNLDNQDFIVLPGVGAFKEGMNALKKNDLIDALKEKVIVKKKKIIGICLGMQMLFTESNEQGDNKGLNFIKGNVRMFKRKKDFSIPVIGWYKTRSLIKQLNDKYFYHIHSYYCDPIDKKSILSETKYHNFSYCSSIQSKNILAFQFHPEKSGINGINLLKKIPQLFK
jgi:glutamine amidotransferase